MPNTTRQQIWYPDGTNPFNPVQNLFSTMATSIDNAISKAGNTRVASAAARTTAFPAPVSGDSVYRTDQQWVETYLTGLSAGANGWYPTSGRMPVIDSAVTAGNSAANGAWTSKTAMPDLATGANANFGGWTFANDSVTPPFPGKYEISATLQFAGNASGFTRGIRFIVGSKQYGSTIPRSGGMSASALHVAASAVATVGAGETIAVQGNQDSGTSLAITLVSFTAVYLGPI